MSKQTCPHCGTTFTRSLDNGVARPFSSRLLSKGRSASNIQRLSSSLLEDKWFLSSSQGETTRVGINAAEAYRVDAHMCPKCGELSIDLLHFLKSEDRKDSLIETISIKPGEKERPVPVEVPSPIAQDYREASRIALLSLKGAATLARRCLQATLRDGYPDMPRKLDLYDEIEWVINNVKLPDEVEGALHALRKAGNFGAHPADDGLTTIYELGAEDLDACFVLLDTFFELLYVSPARKKSKLENLAKKMFPRKSEPDDAKS